VLTAIPAGRKGEPPASAPAAPAPPPSNPFGTFKPEESYQFAVVCLDRGTGAIRWQQVATEAVPHEGHHRDHGFASASPVTDGERLYAYFGSRGLHCYDLGGRRLWERDFGDMTTRNAFGEGASPVLHGDTVLVNWDHEGGDFIMALDKRTGRTRWETERDEPTGWSTPLVVEANGRHQVVVNATGKVRAYDLASGDGLWECGGQTANAIPSPVAGHGLVYVMSGFRGSALHAIRLGRTGDLTGTDAIAWSHGKSTPYVPSPLLYDGLLYFIAGNNGMLSCFDAVTGKPQYEAERLPGVMGVYASPVGAGGRVYVAGRDGTALVLRHGPTLSVLATNKLDDRIDASPAVVGRDLFLRGHRALYCIAEGGPAPAGG
jgi:outer membrane protein assembly factor BamB